MKTEGFLKFCSVLLGVEEKEPSVSDPTLYEIQTHTHSYTGKIVVQDDKMMKVWLIENMKAVKILKENIVRIHIRKASHTQLEQEWKLKANPVYSRI